MLDGPVPKADQVDPDDVWRRVSPWITRDDAELIRIAPYTFRSTVATTWRRGRMFLAGDAAHQMPPFLGQGMCSGIRDAHNLAWKLDLVLRDAADEEVLDTYATERSPHVRAITQKAVELGRVQTVRDKEAGRMRDEQLLRKSRTGQPARGFQFPGYREGFLAPESADDLARGQLWPQGWVKRGDSEAQRFDDASGGGWVLVVHGPSLLGELPPEEMTAWRSARGNVVVLAPPQGRTGDGFDPVTDISGTYASWFDTHDCVAAIVRPDWYVFGSARSAEGVQRLLAADLSRRHRSHASPVG